jgi:putative endonuclease
MQRIHAAAAEFIGAQPYGQLTELRFDLALVDRGGRIEIRENAFAPD